MEIQDFISRYRNAFGEGAPLPLIFYYSDNKLGLTDPSARQWFDEDVMSFVIPACRLSAMTETMDRCCFSDTAGWSRIRSRINTVRRAVPSWD